MSSQHDTAWEYYCNVTHSAAINTFRSAPLSHYVMLLNW